MKRTSIAIAAGIFLLGTAQALDLGRVARGALGQVVDRAVNTVVQPQPQQQQTAPATQAPNQSYTYEEYMAQQSTAQPETTPADETDDWLYESDDEAVAGTDSDDNGDDDDLFGSGDEDDGDDVAGGSLDAAPSEAGDTIEVIATGVGQDSDQARRNALRAAIEQAVGTLIDSETLAENDEVINDKILSYSAGFVESHTVIGEPKTRDGLVTMKIRARVKRTELSRKLEAADIHITDVDGESLFGEALTKIERNQASGDVIAKAMEGFPANIMEIKRSGKPEYNERDKKWIISVEISVNRDKYRAFVKKLLPVLEKVATENKRFTFTVTPRSRDIYITQLGDFTNRWCFLVCTQINDARTNSIWQWYNVPEEAVKAAISAVKPLTFTVDITDKEHDVIVSGTYNMPRNYKFLSSSYATPFAVFPVLGESGESVSAFTPGMMKTTYKLAFDVSPNEFKRMRNVVCKIDQ